MTFAIKASAKAIVAAFGFIPMRESVKGISFFAIYFDKLLSAAVPS